MQILTLRPRRSFLFLFFVGFLFIFPDPAIVSRPAMAASGIQVGPDDFYKIKVQSIEGKTYSLSAYQGQVLLIVNTASACGYTPQYRGLENLYQKYKDRDLVVLGMPCNQFGNQEPGTEKEIKKFCELRFGVHFPLLKKADVKGVKQHPLFHFLLNASSRNEDVKWNFEKFLVGRDGRLLGRFKSAVTPESPELVGEIEKALAKKQKKPQSQ